VVRAVVSQPGGPRLDPHSGHRKGICLALSSPRPRQILFLWPEWGSNLGPPVCETSVLTTCNYVTIFTFSALVSLPLHCSVLNSNSCFLDIHSSYLACSEAIPSSTSVKRALAVSSTLWVSCRSSVAFVKAS